MFLATQQQLRIRCGDSQHLPSSSVEVPIPNPKDGMLASDPSRYFSLLLRVTKVVAAGNQNQKAKR
jgi:hypothetical protein